MKADMPGLIETGPTVSLKIPELNGYTLFIRQSNVLSVYV